MRSKVERHWDEAEGNKGYQTGDSAPILRRSQPSSGSLRRLSVRAREDQCEDRNEPRNGRRAMGFSS
jgi:hypothetical protein